MPSMRRYSWRQKAPHDLVMSAIVVLLSRRRCRIAAGAVLLSLVAIPQARADETPPSGMSIRVDYRATSTCPSRAEFLDSVRRYTAKWSLVEGRGASREFVVALDGPDARTVGTLDIAVGPRKTRRVVSGPSCETVARALAVMVALVIDPAASISEGQGVTPPPPDPGPPEPLLPESPAVDPERREEASRQPGPRSALEVAPQKGVAPRRPARGHRFSLTLREEVTGAVIARPLVVLGAFVDYELPLFADAAEWTGTPILGRPSLGIGVRRSLPTSIGVPGGSTEFVWSAATARVCPLRLRVARERIYIAPCVEGSAGVLQSESQGIPLAQRTSKRWLDAGASLLGAWQFAGPWIMTMHVAVVTPLTRNRFEVVELGSIGSSAPRTELVSQAPELGVAVGLGLGLRL
jgi:hypothetical protein